MHAHAFFLRTTLARIIMLFMNMNFEMTDVMTMMMMMMMMR